MSVSMFSAFCVALFIDINLAACSARMDSTIASSIVIFMCVFVR